MKLEVFNAEQVPAEQPAKIGLRRVRDGVAVEVINPATGQRYEYGTICVILDRGHIYRNGSFDVPGSGFKTDDAGRVETKFSRY